MFQWYSSARRNQPSIAWTWSNSGGSFKMPERADGILNENLFARNTS
jgi:hypothetical protein